MDFLTNKRKQVLLAGLSLGHWDSGGTRDPLALRKSPMFLACSSEQCLQPKEGGCGLEIGGAFPGPESQVWVQNA